MILKKIKLITFLFFVATIKIQAAGIEINDVNSLIKDDDYILDSVVDFELTDEVIDAIDHGVTLYIDVLTRIKRQRKWLWDKTVIERTYSYRLEKHVLSEDYIVTNISSNERQQLPSLNEALSALGNINGLILVPSVALIPERSYTGLIMIQLNIEKLPPSLRPVAYASDEWQLKSGWKEWDIRIVDEE
jgi:hypothetical protein